MKTFIITNTHGEKFEVVGNSYDIDDRVVRVFKDGEDVAAFSNWLSIRVKDAA